MIKTIRRTPSFKRDYKRMLKKHCNPIMLKRALEALVNEDKKLLASKFKDHALTGKWQGFRELHIQQDWLLIYRINKDELQLVLTRTGSHDDLF